MEGKWGWSVEIAHYLHFFFLEGEYETRFGFHRKSCHQKLTARAKLGGKGSGSWHESHSSWHESQPYPMAKKNIFAHVATYARAQSTNGLTNEKSDPFGFVHDTRFTTKIASSCLWPSGHRHEHGKNTNPSPSKNTNPSKSTKKTIRATNYRVRRTNPSPPGKKWDS